MAKPGSEGPAAAISPEEMRVIHGALGEVAPEIARFLQVWRKACGVRAMPRRADVDPVEIPPDLLPHLMITEALEGGARHRYRLVGTEIDAASRRNLTGGIVGEAIPNPIYRGYVLGLYGKVMRLRRPLLTVSNFAHPDLHHIVTQRIMCPLSEDGASVSMIMSCQVFDAHPARWPDAAVIAPGSFRELFEAEIL